MFEGHLCLHSPLLQILRLPPLRRGPAAKPLRETLGTAAAAKAAKTERKTKDCKLRKAIRCCLNDDIFSVDDDSCDSYREYYG